MSNTVGNSNSISEISSRIDLGPTGSLQFQFAKLQLAMAELSKNGAMDYIKQIEDSQKEQKELSAMLQTVRQAQANAKNDKNGVDLPADILTYMKDNNLALPEGANASKIKDADKKIADLKGVLQGLNANSKNSMVASMAKTVQTQITSLETQRAAIKPYTADDLDTVIQSLQARLDQVGSNTQQLMVYVQDFMGQYNSYLQGSNSVIQQGNQTLGELARAR